MERQNRQTAASATVVEGDWRQIAAALPRARLCLLPNAAAGAQLQAALSGVCAPPPVLPLTALLAAAAALPRAPLPQLLQVAAVAAPAAPAQAPLLWSAYDLLREQLPARPPADLLRLANRLTRLFAGLDLALPLGEFDPFANPALCQTGKMSYEAEAAAALWDILRGKNADLLRPQAAALERLASLLSGEAIVAATDEETPPLYASFYARIGARVFALQPPPKEEKLRRFYGDEPPPAGEVAADFADCYEGGGETLGETAALALAAVFRFRAMGAKRIGVAVYDRLLARRLRSAGEAAGVFFEDSDGWRAETLLYGAALRAVAEGLFGEADAKTTDKLLCPPFWRGEDADGALAREWRKRASEAGAAAALAGDLPPPKNNGQELLNQRLRALRAARESPPARRQTAGEWLRLLQERGEAALAAWRQDETAAEVWAGLQEAAAAACGLDAGEFCLWLRHHLALLQRPDGNIESDAVFVPPGSRRAFDAVVLLGCGDTPASEVADNWLGAADHLALGLPSPGDERLAARRAFCRLVSRHKNVAAVWRRFDDSGEETPPHPFWRLLAAQLREQNKLQTLAPPPSPPPPPGLPAPPPPARASAPLPARLGVSSADRLAFCPYRFYAQDLLALQDNDELEEDALPPRQTGIVLHQLLAEFSAKTEGAKTLPQLEAAWEELLVAPRQHPAWGFLAQYWRVCGARSFLLWEEQRRQTWQTQEAEKRVETTWLGVNIVGRIDRVDVDDNGNIEILDYKSGAPSTKKDMNNGDAPQTAIYAGLYAAATGGRLANVWRRVCSPMKPRGVEENDSRETPVYILARLRRTLRKIAAGEPLPANAPLQNCQKCPADGVCRHLQWRTLAAAKAAAGNNGGHENGKNGMA